MKQVPKIGMVTSSRARCPACFQDSNEKPRPECCSKRAKSLKVGLARNNPRIRGACGVFLQANTQRFYEKKKASLLKSKAELSRYHRMKKANGGHFSICSCGQNSL